MVDRVCNGQSLIELVVSLSLIILLCSYLLNVSIREVLDKEIEKNELAYFKV